MNNLKYVFFFKNCIIDFMLSMQMMLCLSSSSVNRLHFKTCHRKKVEQNPINNGKNVMISLTNSKKGNQPFNFAVYQSLAIVVFAIVVFNQIIYPFGLNLNLIPFRAHPL